LEDEVTDTSENLGERFVRLALEIDKHRPGYVDAYFGPEDWKAQAQQHGQQSLSTLSEQVRQLEKDISLADALDPQRRDHLARHLTAMRMSLRLLSGEKVSLAEEAEALYDIRPTWQDEQIFEEGHKLLEEVLPSGGSLRERMQAWKLSLEIPIEKAKGLLPVVIQKLRTLTDQKFNLPAEESFSVEFVSDQPWMAYNWYLGNSKSRIEINTDIPMRVSVLPGLMAHEGYPGHHTDLTIKEKKLVDELGYYEFTVNLLNAPSSVMAEGIATSALEAVLTEDEQEAWLREEILPYAEMTHIDPKRILAVSRAGRKVSGVAGNAAFMLHDQGKSEAEIIQYLQRYGLSSEKEARQTIRFISDPLDRSYVFTYDAGYDLLEELFQGVDRDHYFKRLIEEPVTPSQVRTWIENKSHLN
jgi:hypothetical protein